MSTLETINREINDLFYANGVTVDAPGEEAFWNAVEDVRLRDPVAAKKLVALSGQWESAQADEHLPDTFISVYMPIAGWKAIMYAVDDKCGGEHTPWTTGDNAYRTKAKAVSEARAWAKDEELTYIDTCPTKTDDAPSESVTEQISAILFDTGESK